MPHFEAEVQSPTRRQLSRSQYISGVLPYLSTVSTTAPAANNSSAIVCCPPSMLNSRRVLPGATILRLDILCGANEKHCNCIATTNPRCVHQRCQSTSLFFKVKSKIYIVVNDIYLITINCISQALNVQPTSSYPSTYFPVRNSSQPIIAHWRPRTHSHTRSVAASVFEAYSA